MTCLGNICLIKQAVPTKWRDISYPILYQYISVKKGQKECLQADDDKRWLADLIAGTGMRLAEGAGLLRSDFFNQDGILCVGIKPHPSRSLKTASSERVIPLVGSAKWAANRIWSNRVKQSSLFPVTMMAVEPIPTQQARL